MREIKFRAISVYGGIVYGTGIFYDTINTWLLSHDSSKCLADGFDKNIIDNKTIMQYTGLKDINGKEIYEGDIVKIEDAYASIIFENQTFKFSGKLDGKLEVSPFYEIDLEDYYIKIIGNIYENPELLG